jgi:hypothetical protein
MYQMLHDELIDLGTVGRDFGDEAVSEIESDVAMFKDSKPSLLHLFWFCRDALGREYTFNEQEELFDRLRGFGLTDITRRTKAELSSYGGIRLSTPAAVTYGFTRDGKQFLLRLRLELDRRAAVEGKSSSDDAKD